MNKYQEAIDNLLHDKRGGYLSDAYRNDLGALQELVDKATPKKVKNLKTTNMGFNYYMKTGYCPNDECKSYNLIDRNENYCGECGQALDWSEEDD